MKNFRKELHFHTRQPAEIINITNQVQATLAESQIAEGLMLVYPMHTSSAVYLSDSDTSLTLDFADLLTELVPDTKHWRHDDTDYKKNATGHLKAILAGHSITLPVTSGELDLGTYQTVYYFEFDGQRDKEVLVKIIWGVNLPQKFPKEEELHEARILFEVGNVALLIMAYGFAIAEDPAPIKKATDFELADFSEKKDLAQGSAEGFQTRHDRLQQASTCVFSKHAGKELNGIEAKFRDQGFKMAVIQVGPVDADVEKFYKDLKITPFVLVDANADTAKAYKVKKVPDVFLIKPNGDIVYEDLYSSEMPENIKTIINGGTLKPTGNPGAGKG